jgi:hypothetical protein
VGKPLSRGSILIVKNLRTEVPAPDYDLAT